MAAVDGTHLGARSAFTAHRSVTSVGTAVLVDTVSGPLSARRPAPKIARDGIDDVCLMMLLEGHSIIDQGDLGESTLPAGSSMFFDLARPYAVTVPTDYRELRLYVPRRDFTARVGRIERFVGLEIPAAAPLTSLFNRYLAGVFAALPAMSPHEAESGVDGILHLLSNLVASQADLRRDDADGPSTETVLSLVDRHIAALLGNPTLDVAMLARAVGLSRTRLYEALADRGGVAAAIRDARLEWANRRLLDPAERHITIEEIARGCGLTDYPTFSRAFRRRFDRPPRDVRGR